MIFLKNLDLGKKEFLTYKILLRLGPASIRKVAEHTNINRGTTHDLLRKLIKKGLVGHQLNGKRQHFVAEDPEKLLQRAEEKEAELLKTKKALNKEIIPDLKAQKFIYTKPAVFYYEGDEGIEKVLKDVLKTMKAQKIKKYYVFSALTIRKYLYRFFPGFTKQRIRNKVFVKVIALGKGGEEVAFSKRKWLSLKPGSFPSSYIIIYAHKVALISLTKDELPYGVVIEEKGINQTMKLIFRNLWEKI